MKTRTLTPFALGQVVATPGALAAIERANQTPLEFLDRHARNDYGELDKADQASNTAGLLNKEEPAMVMSAYRTTQGERVWIITEWDRSVTTVLLPEEY